MPKMERVRGAAVLLPDGGGGGVVNASMPMGAPTRWVGHPLLIASQAPGPLRAMALMEPGSHVLRMAATACEVAEMALGRCDVQELSPLMQVCKRASASRRALDCPCVGGSR